MKPLKAFEDIAARPESQQFRRRTQLRSFGRSRRLSELLICYLWATDFVIFRLSSLSLPTISLYSSCPMPNAECPVPVPLDQECTLQLSSPPPKHTFTSQLVARGQPEVSPSTLVDPVSFICTSARLKTVCSIAKPGSRCLPARFSTPAPRRLPARFSTPTCPVLDAHLPGSRSPPAHAHLSTPACPVVNARLPGSRRPPARFSTLACPVVVARLAGPRRPPADAHLPTPTCPVVDARLPGSRRPPTQFSIPVLDARLPSPQLSIPARLILDAHLPARFSTLACPVLDAHLPSPRRPPAQSSTPACPVLDARLPSPRHLPTQFLMPACPVLNARLPSSRHLPARFSTPASTPGSRRPPA